MKYLWVLVFFSTFAFGQQNLSSIMEAEIEGLSFSTLNAGAGAFTGNVAGNTFSTQATSSTMSGNETLTSASEAVNVRDPNGSIRSIKLNNTALEGQKFTICNSATLSETYEWINVTAHDDSLIRPVYEQTCASFVSLQAAPADSGDWMSLNQVTSEWQAVADANWSVTNCTADSEAGFWRRVGDTVYFKLAAQIDDCTGGGPVLNLPTFDRNNNKLEGASGANSNYTHTGLCQGYDASAVISYIGDLIFNNTATKQLYCIGHGIGPWSTTSPFDWQATGSDELSYRLNYPVSGWGDFKDTIAY